MTDTDTMFDIAVVGGGPVGATLACALSDTGLSVALIEAVPFDAEPGPGMRARTTAIAWGTRTLFEQMDLWRDMASAAAPIEHLHVSQRGHFGTVRVHAAEYAVPALGYVLPNLAMMEALRVRMADLSQVEVIAPARFVGLQQEAGHVVLDLARDNGNRRIRTRLLVGADGARSSVREALGIRARSDDYGQSAVVTSVQPEYPHEATAHERFTPDGPIALLPRDAQSCAVVWTLPTARAERVCNLDDAAFTDALQQAFGMRLGALQSAGSRGAFALHRVLADSAVGPRAALIGNAAHALHPAAAQGFNLSVRDVLLLAAMLRERGGDPGDADLLDTWAQARRPDQHRVANFTDRIVRIFSNRVPGLGCARSAGLVGLSLLPGIRHDMARRSMGLGFDPARVTATGAWQ